MASLASSDSERSDGTAKEIGESSVAEAKGTPANAIPPPGNQRWGWVKWKRCGSPPPVSIACSVPPVSCTRKVSAKIKWRGDLLNWIAGSVSCSASENRCAASPPPPYIVCLKYRNSAMSARIWMPPKNKFDYLPLGTRGTHTSAKKFMAPSFTWPTGAPKRSSGADDSGRKHLSGLSQNGP